MNVFYDVWYSLRTDAYLYVRENQGEIKLLRVSSGDIGEYKGRVLFPFGEVFHFEKAIREHHAYSSYLAPVDRQWHEGMVIHYYITEQQIDEYILDYNQGQYQIEANKDE